MKIRQPPNRAMRPCGEVDRAYLPPYRSARSVSLLTPERRPVPGGRRSPPDSAVRPRAQNCLWWRLRAQRRKAMFDNLSEKLGGILDRLTRRGALSAADVDAALREVRRALLEADVALDVARAFVDRVRERAVGVQVIKSVSPGQMVVKLVHDERVGMLGSDADPIDLNAPAPVAVMLVGLQGSGKTTTTAKIAKRLTDLAKRKTLMASLDTRRPAAMEQLAVLGDQVSVDTLPIVEGQTPPQIAQRALQAGRLGGYDVVLLDTAGRITLDEAMMSEAAEVRRAANPHEVLLVADALTGQDAVNPARPFNEHVGLPGNLP